VSILLANVQKEALLFVYKFRYMKKFLDGIRASCYLQHTVKEEFNIASLSAVTILWAMLRYSSPLILNWSTSDNHEGQEELKKSATEPKYLYSE
jgi:hypothetical protein